MLHSDPRLRKFLVARCPEVEPRMEALLATFVPVGSQDITRCEQAVVWEVADLIAYERAPDIYDQRSAIPFDAAVVDELAPLAGATAADVGAGTGRVALGLAPHARKVFAIEPVANLRHHLRTRIARDQITNLLVLDGRLHAMPLEAGRIDVLVTCHALGWNLPAEIAEITRVLRPSGTAIHLFASPPPDHLANGLTAAGYLHDYQRPGKVRTAGHPPRRAESRANSHGDTPPWAPHNLESLPFMPRPSGRCDARLKAPSSRRKGADS